MKPKAIPEKGLIKDSLFFKSLRLAKSNPNKTGLIVLFDILFLVSAFGLQRLSQYFSQGIAIPTAFASAFTFIIFSLIYYLAILFAYSFFKYGILDFIKSMFGKTEFSFRRLGQFYLLNIAIAGIFLAVMMLLNFALASVKRDYAPFVFIFLAVPYSLFLYVILNTSQSLFYEGSSIKGSIKKGFGIAFTRIRSYREIILAIIVSALALWLLFLGGGYLIRLAAVKNYSFYLSAYSYFKQAGIIAFDLIFYIVILINRISFYAVARENK